MKNRLKEIRKKVGLSQYQLARLSGLSQSTVSHIERGAFLPTIDSAYKIAAVLGVRVEELFVPETRELPKPYRAWEDLNMDGAGKNLLDMIIAKLRTAKYEQLRVIYIFIKHIVR